MPFDLLLTKFAVIAAKDCYSEIAIRDFEFDPVESRKMLNLLQTTFSKEIKISVFYSNLTEHFSLVSNLN